MNKIPVAAHPEVRAMFIDQEMSKHAIAVHFGTSIGSVQSALRFMGAMLTREQANERNRRRMAAMTKPCKPEPAPKPAAPFTIMHLVRAAAKVTGESVHDLCYKRRFSKLTRIRSAVFYLAKDYYSLIQIGRVVGGRDHTTVIYGVTKAQAWLPGDWKFAALVESIRTSAVAMKQAERAAITAHVERLAA